MTRNLMKRYCNNCLEYKIIYADKLCRECYKRLNKEDLNENTKN